MELSQCSRNAINVSEKKPFLPRILQKHQIARYFDDCTLEYLWSNILTEELFESWGYSRDDYKHKHKFSPGLSRKIYLHFEITDLNADHSEEISELIKEKQQKSAA